MRIQKYVVYGGPKTYSIGRTPCMIFWLNIFWYVYLYMQIHYQDISASQSINNATVIHQRSIIYWYLFLIVLLSHYWRIRTYACLLRIDKIDNLMDMG